MRPECWTSEGSLSCIPLKSVCHDRTARGATRNCMPDCESILVVRGSWLISVCGFRLCDIRSWKPHVWWFLGIKELLNLLQVCGIREVGTFPWPGRSCEFILLDSVYWCHRTHLYEGNSKSFRTSIFLWETVRVGGVVIGCVWECHMTSQLGKPADLEV